MLLERLKNENNRNIVKNIIGAFVIRGGALIVSVLTLPAFMNFFQEEQVLGVWYTILSIITWILSFDLGIGNGLRNHLVKAIADKDKKSIQQYISSAYIAIGTITVVICGIGYIIFPQISWNSVFNISKSIVNEKVLLEVTQCVFTGIVLQFFLRLISSVLYALQKSSINNLISLVTSVLQLVFVIVAPSGALEQNLLTMAKGYIFISNIPLFIATVIIFTTSLKGCYPTLKAFSKKKVNDVLSLGGIFFLCQILYMVIANTNEFFITWYTNPGNVVEYSIYHKIFGVAGMIFTISLAPIWSAVTKAISERDFIWLNKLYETLKKLAFLATVGEFAITIFLQVIVNIWLQENAIQINYAHALIYAAFGSIFIYQSVLSTIVCGMGEMKLQAICYVIAVVAKVLVIHFGMKIYSSWIIVVMANAIVLLPYCLLQQISLNKKMEKLLKGANNNV